MNNEVITNRMKCKECGTRMTKLYRHRNQHYDGKQWIPIMFWCPECKSKKEIK